MAASSSIDRRTVLDRDAILGHLTCQDPSGLFAAADRVRTQEHGDGVMIRGLLEISNHCNEQCLYCGLRAGNTSLQRFRMTREQIVTEAIAAARSGLETIILQAGEDWRFGPEVVAGIVAEIRKACDATITLSLGEFHRGAYALWRAAGADRYLLKFETSNQTLYSRLRPGRELRDRIACLATLKDLGYQVGSGNMVGLPGQTLGDLADDLLLMARLELDMAGIGPFIPHPRTPLADTMSPALIERNDRTAARACDLEDLTLRSVAIARLIMPGAHLPATTALGSLTSGAREKALKTGANVLMQDITPVALKSLYDIYPDRICRTESAAHCGSCMKNKIESVGRYVQSGHGDVRA